MTNRSCVWTVLKSRECCLKSVHWTRFVCGYKKRSQNQRWGKTCLVMILNYANNASRKNDNDGGTRAEKVYKREILLVVWFLLPKKTIMIAAKVAKKWRSRMKIEGKNELLFVTENNLSKHILINGIIPYWLRAQWSCTDGYCSTTKRGQDDRCVCANWP